MLYEKDTIIKELTKKIEDFEKIEKKGIVEEKEENEILEEKEEKENLSIMINEIDTDSESNPSSPGTIV
jgi:hypothetical protein